MVISRGGGGYGPPAQPSPPFSFQVSFDATPEDPLSLGGLFSNNTQGVGGNVAPTTGTSVRIATRTGGGGVIAMGSIAAQVNYEDSFAFVPNCPGGNVQVLARVFVAGGYVPTDNHELEIILGCKTSASYHRWIECLWSIGGNQQTINQDGDFNGAAFVDIGNSVGDVGVPQDGDYFIAELYRSANRVRWGRIRGGVTSWAQDVTSATYIDGTLGNGMGIAVFRRSIAPDSVAASLGFTDLLIRSI